MRKAKLGQQSIEREAARLSTLISGIGGGAAHNILSATHSDASAAAVVRGDIVTGQTGPVWARLALGASGTVLRSDGTDLAYVDPASYVPVAPGAQNQMIIANATPAWSLLAAPSAQNQVLLTGASPFTPSWSALFDATVPNTIQCDDAAATGSANVAARRDHEHGIVCAAPSANLSVATANAEGVATSFGRSDHSHAITSSSNPGAAASLLASDASGYLQLVGLGIGAIPSSADLHFGTGTGITHADGVAAGQFLRANGTRYVPDTLDIADLTDLAYATPAFTYGTANAAGSADSVVRSDATLAIFDATVPTIIQCDDAAATGSAGVAARRDHAHGITCAAPSANLSVTSTNAEGTSTDFARSDHSHAITSSNNPGAAASLLATDASGHLILDGLGVGTAYTDGTLHVHTGGAGTVTAHTSADDLTIEYSSTCGMSILAPDVAEGWLVWGFPTNNLYHALFGYGPTHATAAGQLRFRAAGSTRLVLDDSGHFYPIGDNTQDLGLTGKRWRTAYIGTSVEMSDDAWIGLGSSAGRLVWDSTAAPDEASFMDCNVGVGAAPQGYGHLEIVKSATASLLAMQTYDTGAGNQDSRIYLMRSNTDTIGSLVATTDGQNLGEIRFYGVDSGSNVDEGAIIIAVQDGAAGSFVPTKLTLYTYSSTGGNTDQLVLNTDGTIEMNGIANCIDGLRTIVSTDDVSSPPTDAELDTAFGTPATVGEGFIGLVDDNNAETDVWLCVAIGSTWWYEALTKAV